MDMDVVGKFCNHIRNEPTLIGLSYTQVSLSRMYCRMWTNVIILKCTQILVEGTNHNFFIWAQFFLNNNKIKIRHVWSQVDKLSVQSKLEDCTYDTIKEDRFKI